MWEIASQRRPFAEIEYDMMAFQMVLNHKRPDTKLIVVPPKEEASRPYIEEYLKIMRESWDQDPDQRPEMASLCERLRNLYFTYKENGGETEFAILSMNFLSLNNDSETQDTTNYEITQKEEESKSDDEINLEKAKNYHEAKNYTAA